MFASVDAEFAHPQRRRRLLAVVAVIALIAATIAVVTFHAKKAGAAPVKAFTAAFHTQDNGQIGLFGNSVMTCPASANGCTAARNAAAPSATTNGINNNDFTMGFVNADTTVSGLTNSSSSTVVAPAAQSSVLFAGLYWGGRTTAGSGGTATTLPKTSMKLRVPGSSTYQTITADTTYDAGDSTTYGSYTNVTSIVKNVANGAGTGTYWGADVAASTGADRFGGWSLIVVFRAPSLPLRDLTVNNGYEYIAANSAGDSFDFGGFLTPPSGTVRSRIGVLSWEGDLGYVGDSMTLNGNALSSTISPASNFFDSANDLLGANVTTRSPNDSNMFGMDVKDIDAPGALPNNATSATVALKTNGDAYYPQAITTTIDLYAPNFSSLVKTVKDLNGNSPAQTGDTLQYTMSFTNSGDDAAVNSVVKDSVPANTTFVPGSLTVSNGSGTAAAQTDATGDDLAEYANGAITARVGASASKTAGGRLEAQQNAPNNTATVTFRVLVNRPAAGTTINNTATLNYTAETIKKDYTYTGNTVSTPVADLADLAVTGSVAPSPVPAGQQLTWTFNVANNGPTASTGTVLTTTIPAELTGVTASYGTAPGTACTINGTTVTCPIGAVASGATVPVVISGVVPSGSTATNESATATVSATTADDVSSNNIATVSAQVSRAADLQVTHTGTASAAPGQPVSYTVTVKNNGPSDAAGVTMTDTLPNSLIFGSVTGDTNCTQTNGVISCPIGALASGATRTYTVKGTIDPGFTGSSVSPSASVTSSSTPDSDTSNNQAAATTTVSGPSADLQITGTNPPATATPGTNYQFAYTALNNGPSTATGVVVTVPLPDGTTFVGVTSRTGTCTYDATAKVATCNVGSLAPNGTTAVLLQTKVDASRTTTIPSIASVAPGTGVTDPVSNNNTGSINAPVKPQADLGVTVTGDNQEIAAGTKETFTVTVTNNGPSDAAGVSVSNPVPNGTAFVSATTSTGTSYDDGTGVWTVNGLPLGQSRTLTLTVRANADSANTAITDTATVSSGTNNDPVSGNDTASFQVSTDAVADVQVTGSANPVNVVAGQSTVLSFPVTNNGPSDATGVTFTYTVPTGVTVTSAAGQNNVTCSQNGQTYSCTIGGLANGATNTITINATVGAGVAPGPLSNNASVTTTSTDPTDSNNSTNTVLTVSAQADLGVTQTLDPTSVNAGQQTTDTVVITNYGPSNAANSRLKITPPTGFTFGTPTTVPPNITCTTPGGVLTCVLNSIAPGTTNVISIAVPVTVDPMVAPGTYGLAAQASTTTPEPANDPHADSVTTNLTVTASADLAVTTTAGPSPIVPGKQAMQTVTVTNNGPSDAQDVTVTIDVPKGTKVSAVTPSQGTCTLNADGTQITCSLGTVSAGTKPTVGVVYDVASSTTGTLTFSGSAKSATTTDPDNTNNSASTAAITVTPQADVAVVATVNDATVVAGGGTTYNFTVSNKGPSDATQVKLSGSLPAGVSPTRLNTPTGVSCDQTQLPKIVCSLDSLPAGTSLTGSLDVTTSPAIADNTTLTNTVMVKAAEADPNTDNNTSSATITVVTAAKLDIRQQSNPSTSVVPGAPYVYRIALGNSGPSDAQNVVLTDTLPVGVTASQAQFDRNGQAQDCTIDNGNHTFTCNLGTVSSGVVVVTVAGVVLAADSTATHVSNHVEVTSTTRPTVGASSPQMVTSDLDKPVTPAADVTFTKTGPDSVAAGAMVTWTLTATNPGPSVARNFVITDPLSGDPDYRPANPEMGTAAVIPDDMPVLTNVTTDNPNCATSADPDRFTDVTCSLGTLAVDQTVTVHVTATVSPSYAKSSIVNTAHMSSTAFLSNGPDSNTSTVDVTTSSDLSVNVVANNNPITPGLNNSYTVTVSNTGPSDAAGTTVTIPVPDGFTGQLTVTDAQGRPVACTANGNGDLVCPIGSVAATTPIALTVTGTVDPARTAAITESASVSKPTGDTTDNNSKSISVAVTPVANLAVTKSIDSAPVAGEDRNYIITVSNAGPSYAHSVRVTDTVDAGVTITGTPTITGQTGRCSVSGQDVTCDIDTLPVTGTGVDPARVNIPVHFASSYTANTYSNSATATSPDDADGASGGTKGSAAQQATLSTAIVATPDKPGTPASGGNNPVAVPGTQVSYQVTVHNGGPSDAASPKVVITLPAGETLSKITPPTGWNCGAPDADRTISCSSDDPLAAKGDAVFTVVVDVDPAATDDQVLGAVPSSPTDARQVNKGATSTVALAPRGDLSVAKKLTATDGSALAAPVAGGNAKYVVTVHNAGPSDGHGVTVTDTLQSGVTLTGNPTVTGSGNSCTVKGQTVSCDVPVVVNGADVIITLPVHFPSTFTSTDFSNQATAVSDDDPDTGNNTGQVSGTVAPADLSTTVTAAPGTPGHDQTAVPGAQVTYTVTAHNAGPSDAASPTVTISLPDGLSATEIDSPTGWTCDIQTLTCTADTLANGADAVFKVTTTVDPSATGDKTVMASTTSSPNKDPNLDNNAGSATVSLEPHADLDVTKTISPTAPVAGRDATYTITVSNPADDPNGPSTAHDVTVTDTVQTGVTIVSTDVAGADLCTVTGQDISCPIASLAPGDTVAVHVRVHFPTTFDTTAFSNSATATLPAGSVDPTPSKGNNTGSVSGNGAPVSDLGTTITATPADPGKAQGSAVPGTTVSYAVEVTNHGPSDAKTPKVIITLGSGETTSAAGITAPAGWTCTGTTTVTCDLTGSLAAGDSASFTVVATVASGATADQTVAASASSPSAEPDPDPHANSASTTAALEPQADLAVTKTINPTVPVAGDNATYTVTVTDNGPSDARDVVVTDTLQTGQTVQGTPSIEGGSCTVDGQTITCTLDTLAAKANAKESITVRFAPDFDVTSFTNSATAISKNTPEPPPANGSDQNNTGQVSGPAAAKADLQVTKKASSPVVAGGRVTWTITVHNAGPSTATDVVITDPVPDEASVQSADIAGDGTGAECTTGSTVTCTADTLPAGGTATVTVVAVVSAAATGSLDNTATATAADQSDSNPGDNVATVSSPIEVAAAIKLTKSVSPRTLTPGTDVTYTITATDTGTSDAVGVAVNDPLADGLEYRSVSTDPAGTPCATDDGVTCTFDRITPGQTVRMLVVVHVADDFDDPTLTNTASASSPSIPVAAPPTTTVTSPVQGGNGIGVTKTVDHPNAGTGDRVTFTVTVVNRGSEAVSPVVIDDRPPAGMTITSIATTAGSYDRSGARWTISTLPAGSRALLHMTVTLTGTGNLVNVATVDPSTPGTEEANSRATATVTAAPVSGGDGGGNGLAYTGVATVKDLALATLLIGLGIGLIIGGNRRRRTARHRA